jgi:hypothetical protein
MTASPIDLASVVVRSREIFDAVIDDEVVALNVDNGFCYGLDPIASRVWRLIETPTDVGAICAALRGEYDVGEAVCLDAVVALLDGLRANGLAVVVRGAGAAPAAA